MKKYQKSNELGNYAKPAILTPHSVGQNVLKQDGTSIVTGKAYYTTDNLQSGLLHLKIMINFNRKAQLLIIDN